MKVAIDKGEQYLSVLAQLQDDLKEIMEEELLLDSRENNKRINSEQDQEENHYQDAQDQMEKLVEKLVNDTMCDLGTQTLSNIEFTTPWSLEKYKLEPFDPSIQEKAREAERSLQQLMEQEVFPTRKDIDRQMALVRDMLARQAPPKMPSAENGTEEHHEHNEHTASQAAEDEPVDEKVIQDFSASMALQAKLEKTLPAAVASVDGLNFMLSQD
ncbi:hypothetical protein BCR43DRAFT_520846 [Syncephalastrum racemosum]|uniref:Uncharacterized protein n=1 Tax=Syncephalastrum racemosum TaxID=13706 RepID=A0A1X2HW39_SYNRA|nr:hypothetical protein BCR43DRAFT_520846 [Syncephalastrum racemosum]